MVFAIATAKEYREKVESDLAALKSAIDNSSFAINAVTSTYHLHEWLWANILKPQSPTKVDGVLLNEKKDFVAFLEAYCPHFRLVQELTNGSKHAYPVHSGSKVGGFGMGPFGIGPYSVSYLLGSVSKPY